MKVIITGGGTGGHVYPGIAIADALKAVNLTTEILFVGAKKKLEMEKVPAAGYTIKGLPMAGFSKYTWKNFFCLPFQLLISCWQAWRIIRIFKPDVVVGTGGYASFPVAYMATLLQVPVLIQEQNAYPGYVNRLLARRAKKICVAYENLNAFFPVEKIVVTGNPVRNIFKATSLSKLENSFYEHFDPQRAVLCLLGGSQGAEKMNNFLLEHISEILDKKLANLIWITGKRYYSYVKDSLEKRLDHQPCPYLQIIPYTDRMADVLLQADLVLSRSGALSISEICMAKKAAVFIPSPNVTDDHQTKNVLPLVEQGAAILVKEVAIETQLMPILVNLLTDPKKRKELIDHIDSWFKPNAAKDIARLIEEISK